MASVKVFSIKPSGLWGFLCVASLCATLGGCQTTPSAVANAGASEALAKEIEVGKAALAKLTGTYGLWQNREATNYLNLYIKALATYVERQELPYQVAILDTDQINAYSLPGGYILITRGALKAVETPGALAGILAHELGHINKSHLANAVKIRVQYSTLESLARFLAGSRQLITATMNQINDQIQEKLFLEGFSADLEFDADAYAVDLLQAAGIDAQDYVDYLASLQHDVDTSALSDIDRTHPPLSTRLDRLQPHLEVGLPPLIPTQGFQEFKKQILSRETTS